MDVTSVADKKVITYATKELSDFLSKIDDVIKTKMGFSSFVDEAHHLIPKLFKGPEVFTNLKSMLHRLSGSGFHGILSKNMQAMRSTLQNLDDVFKNLPLDSAAKFADFVADLSAKNKNLLKQQIIQSLKKSYKELLKNDELYKEVLKQLDSAITNWDF